VNSWHVFLLQCIEYGISVSRPLIPANPMLSTNSPEKAKTPGILPVRMHQPEASVPAAEARFSVNYSPGICFDLNQK